MVKPSLCDLRTHPTAEAKQCAVWMAGGGAKGGFVFGLTDELGYAAAENPVHMHDFNATILHLLGIDHERLNFRYQGLDVRLTDVHGHVVKDLIA